MNFAGYVLLWLNILSLGVSLCKHGEPKRGKYNFFARLIAFGITMFLYYKAGLFG